ncbi:MAG: hypothetical protein MK179_02010 [Pirellulaceae bacterium]|nr:hypothetical protein [Pirellulaceae bacterium]
MAGKCGLRKEAEVSVKKAVAQSSSRSLDAEYGIRVVGQLKALNSEVLAFQAALENPEP